MSEALIPLLDEIRQCNVCEPHLPLGPNPVLRASRTAKILIAAQAPGTKVHQTGIPFNDPSGDRLREWLGLSSDVFYDQHKVAIIPMGFCYPGKGRSGDLPPRPECAATWREKLLSELSSVVLTLVIGQYAYRYHMPERKEKLTDAVKNWSYAWPHTVLLPHPSPRNNIWLKKHPWFEKNIVPRIRRRVSDILC